jgi:Rrf2 family nitric oxide-sensitive transcriptional repressor
MRLTFYSDYSLRLLMYLALRQDALVTIQDVAGSYRISKNHLTKVAYDLGRAGFLKTVRGRNGGIRLAMAPADIGLGNVLRVTESDLGQVECFDAGSNMCVISGSCRLKGILTTALAAYFSVLDQYTLADLTRKHSALSRLLMPV